jgi:hypothetical protein
MWSHLTLLFTSLSFLKIKSPDLLWFKWIYPTILGGLLQLGFWLLPSQPILFGLGGIIDMANSLLGMLIGFYIAAMAAIATFPNSSLDQPMKGRPLTITVKRNNQKISETLTRRRFLCMLFGYCAFTSIVIYLLGSVSRLVMPSMVAIDFLLRWKIFFKFGWLSFYFFMSSSLLVTTLLGLHYLIERMHRE